MSSHDHGRLAPLLLALSATGFVGIISLEGYTGTASPPVKGDVPTYGFGTTTHPDGRPVKAGEKISPPQAMVRALQDASKFEAVIKNCVTVPLHQHEYDAFVSLAYNIGPGAFCGSTLVKRLAQQQYAEACGQILNWKHYQRKDCSLLENAKLCGGLWKRRQAEYKQCMGVPQ